MRVKIKAIISDMDGVLWRGNQPLPGMKELFVFMFDKRIPFALATNNSRNTRQDYVQKLAALGVNGIKTHHIITSGTATASYLQTVYPAGTKVFVVGGRRT